MKSVEICLYNRHDYVYTDVSCLAPGHFESLQRSRTSNPQITRWPQDLLSNVFKEREVSNYDTWLAVEEQHLFRRMMKTPIKLLPAHLRLHPQWMITPPGWMYWQRLSQQAVEAPSTEGHRHTHTGTDVVVWQITDDSSFGFKMLFCRTHLDSYLYKAQKSETGLSGWRKTTINPKQFSWVHFVKQLIT